MSGFFVFVLTLLTLFVSKYPEFCTQSVQMGFFDGLSRAFGFQTAKAVETPEKRMLQGNAVDELLLSRIFQYPNNTKQAISADSVLSLSTVWRAVNIISDSIASLPVNVMEMRADGSRSIAMRHPVQRQMAFQPSINYTKYNFFQTIVSHALLFGNGYVEINRERVTGYPKNYTILAPDRVTVKERNGVIYYEYTEKMPDATNGMQASVREIRAGNMVHINGLSWNGVTGLQVMRMLADNFGLALANQQYLNKFFSEGATISGVLRHPGRLTADAIKRLRDSWTGTYGGSTNSGKVAIVEEGMEYQAIGLSPQQAGAADTKKLTISDIARIFGVPQFLLEDLDRATFSNIEHLSLLFRQHTIRPWCKRIEAELNTKLFPADEQVAYQVVFDIDDLAMSDLDSRSKWVESMMKWGILNRDEVRKKEGYNPIADGTGQDYYIPMNMTNPAAPAPAGGQLDMFDEPTPSANAVQ